MRYKPEDLKLVFIDQKSENIGQLSVQSFFGHILQTSRRKKPQLIAD